MTTRRLRGALLRFAYRRRVAFLVGAGATGAAVWIGVGDYAWESALTDGLGMLVGATGVALMLTAAGGRQPDWEG